MSSPSPSSSATASQTVRPEEITNQTLMNVIMDLRAQVATLVQRQDELTQLVLDLRRESAVRTEPDPSTVVHSAPEPASSTVPSDADPEAGAVATDSTPSSGEGAGLAVGPPVNQPTLPIPAAGRRIRRQNAFYHIPGAEEAPWKVPSDVDYRPFQNGTPTRGGPTPGRSTSSSLGPPASSRRESCSHGEGNRPPLPYSVSPFRFPAMQRSHPSTSLTTRPLPQAMGPPTLPARSAPRTGPLYRDNTLYQVSWFARTPFRAPGSGISQPPPPPPTAVPAVPSTPFPSPKRKREDAGDGKDDGEASDKKRPRRHPSSDDVD